MSSTFSYVTSPTQYLPEECCFPCKAPLPVQSATPAQAAFAYHGPARSPGGDPGLTPISGRGRTLVRAPFWRE